MTKAIIFDVDGVLVDSLDANLKFFQNLMKANGYEPPTREQYQKMFHLNMRDVIRTLTKSASPEKIEEIWEMGRNRDVAYDVSLLKNPDELEYIIEDLNKNYLLGIVTSRVKESVFESLRLANLRDYFKATVCAQDTQSHKPHPEPLLLAAKRLNVNPEECIYIGDNENDIIASRAANMKVIIYSAKIFDQADANTSSFAKLPELIKKIEKQS